MEPPPLEFTSEILFGIEEKFVPNHIEKFVNYLSFLKYRLNNLNAKANPL